MATGTLQSRLTVRLLAVLVVALLASAVASICAAANSLDASEDRRCAAFGRAAIESFNEEIGEGNAPAESANTVSHDLHADDALLAFAGLGIAPGSGATVLAHFEHLPDGTCEAATVDGSRWRGCAIADGGRRVFVAVAADDAAQVLKTLITWTAAVLALAIFAGAFAIRFALRAPLRSLARLAAWSERVADGDSAAFPASEESSVEIEKLSASIDRLYKSVTETLAREQANSAHIAHEMRTPLTAIRAELATLGSTLSGPSREAVARLQMDSERLSRVIDSVLVLSSPGGRAHGEAPVNVADLARTLAPKETAVDAPDEALVEADEHLLALALTNLFENASKYGGGARAVRLERAGDGVRISVVDDGAGLDAAARDRIFERYWRESVSASGSGIGLALVRAVAERHGGKADARAADGGGLDVGFTVAPLLAWHGGELDDAR